MALRTLSALLPGYTVHLAPYSAAPCSCLQPAGGLAGPRGAQAYTCSAAVGDTPSPGGEKAPLLTYNSGFYSNGISTHPKTLPSFSSFLSLTSLLSSEYFLSLTHRGFLSPSLNKRSIWAETLYFPFLIIAQCLLHVSTHLTQINTLCELNLPNAKVNCISI